ncbi:MAG: PqqD family protein [Clostridia bacterium]|nr:PqqD family protein [Clostridia bacterium]MBQ7897845.1 PqqD family protein [Clostridia bacterium]
MKKKTVVTKNYLEGIPYRPQHIRWTSDEKGIVTLEIENRGFMNRVAQKLFRKPKISYIHLDETGSFIWPLLDGEKSIMDLGALVEEHFGEKSHPLYERLAKYFMILDSYGFVKWANK